MAQIAGAEAPAGRSAGEIRLAAVGKTFPVSDICEVYVAEQRNFGENYTQEWYGETEDLADLFNIVWHIIDDVQSNKTKFMVEHAHQVHTIGRPKIARHLGVQGPSEMPPLQVYIEVNITDKTAKHGVAPDGVVALACEAVKLPNLKMHGLMCMAKAGAGKAELREAFGRVRTLLVELNAANVAANILSIGTSGNMKITVACGATCVRIDSAVFSRRDYSK